MDRLPKPFLRQRLAGDPCDREGCERTDALLRVNPRAHDMPGVFMCALHAFPRKVYLWENGMVMVFDATGEQMPELQGQDCLSLRHEISRRSTDATAWEGFGPEGPCEWRVPTEEEQDGRAAEG